MAKEAPPKMQPMKKRSNEYASFPIRYSGRR